MARGHIGLRTATSMVASYAWRKLSAQVRAVTFIIVYLIAFQRLVLSIPLTNAFGIAIGVGALVFGLTFFLEGLVLGLMPLGERVGLQLPITFGLPLLVVFALLLGVGSTLAEPAIAALRAAGSGVRATDAPLLYAMLTDHVQLLVYTVGAGVGIAVLIGVLRFYFGLPLKPFLYSIVPLLIVLTVYASVDERLRDIVGLAWDTGAVTTGAVTVPMVLAVGIGVSRATGKSDTLTGGFGVIALASAIPVVAVLILAIVLAPGMDAGPVTDGMPVIESLVASESEAVAPDDVSFAAVFFEETGMAARAVLPLSVFLLLVLLFLLRLRPRYLDELALGIVLCLGGMALITTGIRTGLAPLGDEVGQQLPRVFQGESEEVSSIVIDPFDESVLLPAIGRSGNTEYFFYLVEGNSYQAIPFVPDRLDTEHRRYVHPVIAPPLFGPDLTPVGIALVFLFAFGLGFGSTLAEPALGALGRTVEEITVGTIRKNAIVHAVSIGVGVGLMAGVGRIMYDIPLWLLLLPPYVVALPLTYLNDEGFAGIAWDCGGVTTGTITVPLVIAMGLGIGGALGVADGFGILALASIYPIISVLLYGIIMDRRRQRTLRVTEQSGAEQAA